MEKRELAQALNLNSQEFELYIQGVGRALSENFLPKVVQGVMTIEEAIKNAVELWDRKQKDMSMQILSSPVEGNGCTRKSNQLSDILFDEIYEKFNN
tara:strand:+ start:176 stop:466 length:291 start_codon:yes stop_codon:yes gene_type:complete